MILAEIRIGYQWAEIADQSRRMFREEMDGTDYAESRRHYRIAIRQRLHAMYPAIYVAIDDDADTSGLIVTVLHDDNLATEPDARDIDVEAIEQVVGQVTEDGIFWIKNQEV